MKVLVTRVAKLEGKRRRRTRGEVVRAVGGVSLIWSSAEGLAAQPHPDFGLAIDIHDTGNDFGGVEGARTVERPATAHGDLGNVYDSTGMLVGRVTYRDGSLVRIEPTV